MPMRPPLVCALILAAATAAPLAAQGGDADAREVRAYTLTMPKLRQLSQAMLEVQKARGATTSAPALEQKKKELAALSEKDSPTRAEQDRMAQLEREIEDAEEADEDAGDTRDQSLSDLAARMAADPQVSGALKRAGLAPREAAVMQFALFQAGFAASMLESGTIKEIPKDVNADNVKFYQANKAELEGLAGLNPEGRGE